MRQSAFILILIVCIVGVWWFWGREPYITMGHPSDPILIYHQPRWNGWDSRGMKWMTDIPQEIKDDFPGTQGWWYVVHRTVPKKDLPKVDIKNPEKTLQEWEKYYTWIPLMYGFPNHQVGQKATTPRRNTKEPSDTQTGDR
jgi:hypothetical protein